MDKNKSQIILLDKSGLESVAKALSSGCWTLSDSDSLDIGSCVEASSRISGSAPQLTLAQGNVRPVTQVSGSGGSANKTNSGGDNGGTTTTSGRTVERPPAVFHRDTSQVATLTELGKKLVAAAKVGNTNQVRRLMAIGAPFASDGPIGMTPLHLAAQNGHYSTCDRLLCAGMNKDAKNKVDKTPLHLAAMEGHTSIVLLLVKHGANVNSCDMLKMTALHWACDRGHTAIVHLLLKHDANNNVTNKFFKTPLQLAVENGHDDVCVLLKGGIFIKEESEYYGGSEEEEGEGNVDDEDMCVDSIAGLDIPGVEKIEEVRTQELLVHELSERSNNVTEGSKNTKDDHNIPTVETELPHSILSDDLEDQNISVLATLAELAHATPRVAQASVDMTNAAALELLKAQAALLDDPPSLVTSALAHGQTLHLTEAGRQALNIIKQEIPLLPTNTLPKEPPDKSEEERQAAAYSTGKASTTKSPDHHNLISDAGKLVQPSPSCLPALLPPTPVAEVLEEVDEESQEVTQVITLSPEQYAALTGSSNGPILLQVLEGCEGELTTVIDGTQPTPAKKQKVMQLVTRVADTTRISHPIAKVSGQVLSVDLPSVSDL